MQFCALHIRHLPDRAAVALISFTHVERFYAVPIAQCRQSSHAVSFRSGPSGQRGGVCAPSQQVGGTCRSTPLEDVSMKQSCVSAFARAARRFALAAVALGFGAGSLLAQGSTGKLEGRVRDQAGAPIANAQVFIVGSAFNALTNPQGYYFINNVPAGTYNVRAAFIGYKSTQVDGVKVLAGQTGTVDIQLEQTAVQIQEITVVQQTQPLVPRDEVTTKQRIDGEFTNNLPVDRLTSVLALQPGVVASPTNNTLSIRGGRTDEAVTYVDGVPISPGYRGGSNVGSLGTEISVGTNALEEASVTTGSASAEFGNAQSGVISVQTKTGGSDYTGTLN